MAEEELQAMIDEFDTDGDGEISQEVRVCVLNIFERFFVHIYCPIMLLVGG